MSQSIPPAASHHLAHRPSYVAESNYRFLIMDAPTDQNLPSYIEECKKYNVNTIVRACEPTYSIVPLTKCNMSVVEMPFPDGDPPPAHIVDNWLRLCEEQFSKNDQNTLAVHCVAGLGRAPVLVVIALVEQGMEPLDAVEFVRKKRRGALNSKQVKYLESYKKRSRGKSCLIM